MIKHAAIREPHGFEWRRFRLTPREREIEMLDEVVIEGCVSGRPRVVNLPSKTTKR